jgi:hypothetical protein
MKKHNLFVLVFFAICAMPMLALGEPDTPIVPEPSTMIAGAACLIPLAVGVVRALGKSRK